MNESFFKNKTKQMDLENTEDKTFYFFGNNSNPQKIPYLTVTSIDWLSLLAKSSPVFVPIIVGLLDSNLS